jgi:hypothetical protein
MNTDTKLRYDRMRILAENIGIVNMDHFIIIMFCESFDYTPADRLNNKSISYRQDQL